MAKADLHVHSKFSDYPSTWVLKAYQSPESFTEPEMVYQQAKARGMNLVTITDHDDIRGCLELQQTHPKDTFISCELTSYFPTDNCKVHVLVYGISAEQYVDLMTVRKNLFELRDYIAQHDIAYSLAHATYDQDGKLQFEHIEQLVLLFDVFEVINGSLAEQSNNLILGYLNSLNQQQTDQLQAKYNIKPISADPWVKGFTGGSDDHCGILIGSAYTQNIGNTVEEFLQCLRSKSSIAQGQHGSFAIYATGVIKHVHDYRQHRDERYTKTKMFDFMDMFFLDNRGNWLKRFKKSHSLRYLKRKNNRTHKALHTMLSEIEMSADQDIADKIPAVFQRLTELHDELFRSVAKALMKAFPRGEIFKGFQQLASLFPTLLLVAPFVGSMRHQLLKSSIRQNLSEADSQRRNKSTLWFTDTIDDLNGVSVSLRQTAQQSQKLDYAMKLVCCVDAEELRQPLPANTINLPLVYANKIPGYEQQQLAFPSLLNMMQRIIEEQPDEIIISTPGPVGLGALLCAKLMDLPVKAIFHTDFAEQVLRITDEVSLANSVDKLVTAFYQQVDHIYVPSQSYLDKLQLAGMEPSKLSIFPRAIDTEVYQPKTNTSANRNTITATGQNKLQGQFTLLFAGRISEDKNLDVLIKLTKKLNNKHPGRYNFVVAGDGPALSDLKQQLHGQSNTLFTGRIEPAELVRWYQASDLLLFPSHTDTFGMVVLEAQACGLPCLVSASGGPKEIIEPSVTGQIIYSDLVEDWYAVVEGYFRMKFAQPENYKILRQKCAQHALNNNNWQNIFDTVLGPNFQQRSVIKKQFHTSSARADTANSNPQLAA